MSEYTITDKDVLKAIRHDIEVADQLIPLCESYAAYADFTGIEKEDRSFGTPAQIRALHVGRAQSVRLERILAHVIEGAELPPGATETSPEVNESIQPENKKPGGGDPSGLFGKFLN